MKSSKTLTTNTLYSFLSKEKIFTNSFEED